MNDIDFNKLEIPDHFIARCVERTPWLTTEKSKKDGGGHKLLMNLLETAITTAIEIERPTTITRLLKYGHRSKYYHYTGTKLKRQVVFVINGNTLVTISQYRYSWAANNRK